MEPKFHSTLSSMGREPGLFHVREREWKREPQEGSTTVTMSLAMTPLCRGEEHSPIHPVPSSLPDKRTGQRQNKDLPPTRWAVRRAAPGPRGDISVQHFDRGSAQPAPGVHTKTHSGVLRVSR